MPPNISVMMGRLTQKCQRLYVSLIVDLLSFNKIGSQFFPFRKSSKFCESSSSPLPSHWAHRLQKLFTMDYCTNFIKIRARIASSNLSKRNPSKLRERIFMNPARAVGFCPQLLCLMGRSAQNYQGHYFQRYSIGLAFSGVGSWFVVPEILEIL